MNQEVQSSVKAQAPPPPNTNGQWREESEEESKTIGGLTTLADAAAQLPIALIKPTAAEPSSMEATPGTPLRDEPMEEEVGTPPPHSAFRPLDTIRSAEDLETPYPEEKNSEEAPPLQVAAPKEFRNEIPTDDLGLQGLRNLANTQGCPEAALQTDVAVGDSAHSAAPGVQEGGSQQQTVEMSAHVHIQKVNEPRHFEFPTPLVKKYDRGCAAEAVVATNNYISPATSSSGISSAVESEPMDNSASGGYVPTQAKQSALARYEIEFDGPITDLNRFLCGRQKPKAWLVVYNIPTNIEAHMKAKAAVACLFHCQPNDVVANTYQKGENHGDKLAKMYGVPITCDYHTLGMFEYTHDYPVTVEAFLASVANYENKCVQYALDRAIPEGHSSHYIDYHRLTVPVSTYQQGIDLVFARLPRYYEDMSQLPTVRYSLLHDELYYN